METRLEKAGERDTNFNPYTGKPRKLMAFIESPGNAVKNLLFGCIVLLVISSMVSASVVDDLIASEKEINANEPSATGQALGILDFFRAVNPSIIRYCGLNQPGMDNTDCNPCLPGEAATNCYSMSDRDSACVKTTDLDTTGCGSMCTCIGPNFLAVFQDSCSVATKRRVCSKSGCCLSSEQSFSDGKNSATEFWSYCCPKDKVTGKTPTTTLRPTQTTIFRSTTTLRGQTTTTVKPPPTTGKGSCGGFPDGTQKCVGLSQCQCDGANYNWNCYNKCPQYCSVINGKTACVATSGGSTTTTQPSGGTTTTTLPAPPTKVNDPLCVVSGKEITGWRCRDSNNAVLCQPTPTGLKATLTNCVTFGCDSKTGTCYSKATGKGLGKFSGVRLRSRSNTNRGRVGEPLVVTTSFTADKSGWVVIGADLKKTSSMFAIANPGSTIDISSNYCDNTGNPEYASELVYVTFGTTYTVTMKVTPQTTGTYSVDIGAFDSCYGTTGRTVVDTASTGDTVVVGSSAGAFNTCPTGYTVQYDPSAGVNTCVPDSRVVTTTTLNPSPTCIQNGQYTNTKPSCCSGCGNYVGAVAGAYQCQSCASITTTTLAPSGCTSNGGYVLGDNLPSCCSRCGIEQDDPVFGTFLGYRCAACKPSGALVADNEDALSICASGYGSMCRDASGGVTGIYCAPFNNCPYSYNPSTTTTVRPTTTTTPPSPVPSGCKISDVPSTFCANKDMDCAITQGASPGSYCYAEGGCNDILVLCCKGQISKVTSCTDWAKTVGAQSATCKVAEGGKSGCNFDGPASTCDVVGCPTGKVCVDKHCINAPKTCTSDSQCSSYQSCKDGVCVTSVECTHNADCPTGMRCVDHSCEDKPVIEEKCTDACNYTYMKCKSTDVILQCKDTEVNGATCKREVEMACLTPCSDGDCTLVPTTTTQPRQWTETSCIDAGYIWDTATQTCGSSLGGGAGGTTKTSVWTWVLLLAIIVVIVAIIAYVAQKQGLLKKGRALHRRR